MSRFTGLATVFMILSGRRKTAMFVRLSCMMGTLHNSQQSIAMQILMCQNPLPIAQALPCLGPHPRALRSRSNTAWFRKFLLNAFTRQIHA